MAVCTTTGIPVASTALWAAPGEPLQILFDTSDHGTSYLAYLGAQPTPTNAEWHPHAGVVLETRPLPPAPGPLESRAEWLALWNQTGPPFGRAVVPHIFDAAQPLGPPEFYLSRYEGYFVAARTGTYVFATVSDDASFLLVDDQPVAAWPGWHTVKGGMHGSYTGRLRLDAGVHRLEYDHAQKTHMACAEVAWQPPGADHLEVMPSWAFVPLVRFRVSASESLAGKPAAASFEWDVEEHCQVDDTVLITLRFRALNPAGRFCCWTFPDGVQAEGAEVRHTFIGAGVRTVRLERRGKEREVTPVEATVRVQPRWSQEHECPPDAVARQGRELAVRDPATFTPDELAALVAFADALQEHTWLDFLGTDCLARAGALQPQHAPLFLALARHYIDPEVRRYDLAERALRAGLARHLPDSVVEPRLQLRLADLLLNYATRADEAAELLRRMRASDLTPDERRRREILLADVLLARGETQPAREAYGRISAGTKASPAQDEVRRAA